MAKPQRVMCFVAGLEDKPGSLLQVLNKLKAKNVSLAGLWGFSTEPGKAWVYTVGKNANKLRTALKDAGLTIEEKTAFFVRGTDRPGALLKTLTALAEAKINITAIDAIAVGGRFGSYIWVSDPDVERACKVLSAK